MHKQKWSDEETERLLDLMKTHGRNFKVIGHLLNRSPQSAEHRWRWTTLSRDQILEKAAKERVRQAAMRAAYRSQGNVKPAAKIEVPDDVIIERNARFSAPRTISAFVLGDPPPGFSALDRKRQGLPV